MLLIDPAQRQVVPSTPHTGSSSTPRQVAGGIPTLLANSKDPLCP